MAKKLLPKLYIALWMLLLVGLGSYYLFLAPRDSAASQKENRMLAGFPEVTAQSVFSGAFGQEFETYLLDRFPGRNAVIDATNYLEGLTSFATYEDHLLIMEVKEDPLITGDVDVDMEELLAELNRPAETKPAPTEAPATDPTETGGDAETAPEETKPVEDPPIVPKPEASPDDFPDNGGLFIDIGGGEQLLEGYYQPYVLASAAILNRYARLLPENGKLIFTVPPSSYWVMRYKNAETRNSFYTTWDEMIYALTDDNVYTVDTCEIFAEHIDEYVVFRTDIHWTIYGTHLIYSAMAELAGKTPSTYPDDFDIVTDDTFQGSPYRDHPASYQGIKPDVLEYVTPKVDFEFRRITGPDEYIVVDYLDMSRTGTERYTAYMGGPAGPWHYFQCDNDETENCLVVCDSFGLSFVPMLTANYNQVHYYEPRKFDRSIVGYSVAEMIEKYNIQDIYVVLGDFHVFNNESLLNMFSSHMGE